MEAALHACRAHGAPASQEDDDALSADKFIQKAGFLLSESKDEALELQYNTCYARILDSKRKFIEAALRYYHLSQLAKREIGAPACLAAPHAGMR